ncbi:AAA family ATPase [Paracoccus tegillarcae]|uniref:Chromosome partitioning protein n=1 Tax=Paracoccus tegillarcae TaxID=1529068 RepID=A0A2K9F949_9RHOB|nr:AAA family ATPase [Paracoccus tegillarcae]AUH35721.1 hypothetical protein CUV01_19250 [Paracoccus tegillarcae]
MKTGTRVITAMNRKGGCGKTTLIRGLASAAVATGNKVTIFDTDGSESLSAWKQRSQEAGDWNEMVNLITTLDAKKVERGVEAIFAQPQEDHLILIDTFGGGAAPKAQDLIADLSHLIIVPMMLSEDDLAETLATGQWYINLRKRVDNPENIAPFFVLGSRIPAQISVFEREILQEAMSKLPVLDEFVQYRNAYLRMGNGVLGDVISNMRNRANAEHIKDALDEMTELLRRFDEIIKENE